MNATLIISGKQKKQVRDRIKEHQNNIRIGEQNSMIFQHVANNTAIWTSLIPQLRRILETFYSQNSTHAINRFMEVPDVYFPVVRKHINLIEH